MSTAISVENLGKKYLLKHQSGQQQYVSLRDVIADTCKALGRKLAPPFMRYSYSQIPNPRSLISEEFWALKDVSFQVKQGDRIGIIGRNGAGKSTLLKILSRITEPTTGSVRIKGRVASLLEVGTGFHPELTGRENIYLNGAILGMSRAEIRKKFDEIVAFADIEKFLDTPVKRYSSGMYVRLAFAVAAHLEPEILVVDEVLAVGDAQFQKKCLGKMEDVSAREGRTVLFVSHNMGAVEALCTQGMLLADGQVARVGPICECIGAYMDLGLPSTVQFSQGAVRRASVVQQGDNLELSVDYQLDAAVQLPCLGFVISDLMGQPICGGNPKVYRPERNIAPAASGKVSVSIRSPKLLNGTYKISLWFGDGLHDFFYQPDCLMIDVTNMLAVSQQSIAVVGPVIPDLTWTFE